MDLSTMPPWSNGRLDRLGNALVDGGHVPEGCPSYGVVMNWHAQLASEVAAAIDANSVKGNDVIDVAFRVKTLDTLVDKLVRSPIRLSQVQDVAGVRVDGDFDLVRQDEIATEIAGLFGHDASALRDRRSESQAGYRALHLHLRFPAGRVEVQVRTRTQSAWANAYEAFADKFGRELRYRSAPVVLSPRVFAAVTAFQEVSSAIQDAENDEALWSVIEQTGVPSVAEDGEQIDPAAQLVASRSWLEEIRATLVRFEVRLRGSREV